MSAKKYNNIIVFLTLFMLICLFLLVTIVDPFSHYHSKLENYIEGYSNEQEYAMYWLDGRARNTRADAILIGSSLSTFIRYESLSEIYNTNCMSLVKSSGRSNIYKLFINRALENNDLDYVFYEFHLPHMSTDYEGDIPEYIFNDDIFDDVNYVLNKDVIDKSLSVFIKHFKFMTNKEEGKNNDLKENEVDTTVANSKYGLKTLVESSYVRKSSVGEDEVEKFLKESKIRVNENIVPLVKKNPDTKFVFIMPPVSILRAYDYYWTGCLDEYLDAYKEIIELLINYENVEIHMFYDVDGFVNDLNNYMDSAHYSEDGAKIVYDGLKTKENMLTVENIDERLIHIKELAKKFEIPFLKKGFEGNDVLELQNQLNKLGYVLKVNNVYDNETVEVVKKFQKDNNLEVTGIAMPETRELLKSRSDKE